MNLGYIQQVNNVQNKEVRGKHNALWGTSIRIYRPGMHRQQNCHQFLSGVMKSNSANMRH